MKTKTQSNNAAQGNIMSDTETTEAASAHAPVIPTTSSITETRTQALDRLRNEARPVWEAFVWTPERIELARKTVCPPTATPDEFAFFLEWCGQTGLNPFLKQAFLIERWDAANNSKRHEPMAAEAGFAARADALPDFGGIESGVVYAGDDFGIDEAKQEIRHVWSAAERAKNGNKVLGAWARATRVGRKVEISYVTFDSRAGKKRDGTLTKFWATDPAGQLRKCARADQYRRAYPNIFAGVYDVAESAVLDEGEIDVTPRPPGIAPSAGETKTSALTDFLKRTASTSKAAATVTVKPSTSSPAPKASPPKGAKSSAPPITALRFGPSKGKPLSEASVDELEAAAALAREQVAKASGSEGWLSGTVEGIQAIVDELAARSRALDESEPMPEPGSEG